MGKVTQRRYTPDGWVTLPTADPSPTAAGGRTLPMTVMSKRKRALKASKPNTPLAQNGWLVCQPALDAGGMEGADATPAAAPAAAEPALLIGSPEWAAWLAEHATFDFRCQAGHFNARRENRRNIAYWYAYRRRDGRLHKAYLGRADEVTQVRLEQVCVQLAGHAPVNKLPRPSAHDHGLAAVFKTKLQPPALPEGLVARVRLIQRINAPITVVYAPSGYGKSTLLNAWRQTCTMPVAWVSLDTDDSAPHRFWQAIASALSVACAGFQLDLHAHGRAASPADLQQLAASVTNEIVRVTEGVAAPGVAAGPRMGLVLDDYHSVTDPQTHATLQTFLEHMPATLRLVIASHTRPPLALGHLRARGLLAELAVDDLRFTSEEGAEFLSAHTLDCPLAPLELVHR